MLRLYISVKDVIKRLSVSIGEHVLVTTCHLC